MLISLIKHEVNVAFAQRSQWGFSIVLFILVVSLFPLSLDVAQMQWTQLIPAVIWVPSLLAITMSQEALIKIEFEEGSLEQLVLSPHPLWILMFSRALASWITVGLPILLMMPVLGLMLKVPFTLLPIVMLSLGIGTLTLCFLGPIGGMLTVGLSRASLLLAILMLPLYTPILIFGAGAIQNAQLGLTPWPNLALLFGLLSLSMSLGPFASAGALKASGDY